MQVFKERSNRSSYLYELVVELYKTKRLFLMLYVAKKNYNDVIKVIVDTKQGLLVE